MSEITGDRVSSRRSWLPPVALALSIIGLVGAIVFWLLVPLLLAIAGTVLGFWARRSAVAGRAAQWALVLGLLAIAVNVGLMIAGAAGAFDD